MTGNQSDGVVYELHAQHGILIKHVLEGIKRVEYFDGSLVAHSMIIIGSSSKL